MSLQERLQQRRTNSTIASERNGQVTERNTQATNRGGLQARLQSRGQNQEQAPTQSRGQSLQERLQNRAEEPRIVEPVAVIEDPVQIQQDMQSNEDSRRAFIERIRNRTRDTETVSVSMTHCLETGNEVFIQNNPIVEEEEEEFVSDDGSDEEEEEEDTGTCHSSKIYDMSTTYDSAPKMSANAMNKFITGQASKGGFDPIATIDQERDPDAIARERRQAGIRALLPKKYKEKDFEKEWKKAEKEYNKRTKVSAGAQKIKSKNNAKKADATQDKDELAISNLVAKVKHLKTLKSIGEITSKLQLENVNDALSRLFLAMDDGELKRQLFIELVERMGTDGNIANIATIQNTRFRQAMERYANNFNREQQIEFCFTHRQSVMAPFSTLTKTQYKSESFQMQAVNHIIDGKSILVSAPTSAGKTIISQYCTSLEGKTLMIQPTQELVDQCAATMIMRGTSVAHLNNEQVKLPNDWKVMVGTPESIWRFLMLQMSCTIPENVAEAEEFIGDIEEIIEESGNPSTEYYQKSRTFDPQVFKYIVIDEIQQMNTNSDGTVGNQALAMQSLLMYFTDKQLILLSATIQNSDNIIQWIKYLKDDITTIESEETTKFVQYDKRFINQEIRVFTNGEPTVISPLSILTFDFIASGRLLTTEMQIPPRQLPELSQRIIELRPESAVIDINAFFDNIPVTIEGCKRYEDVVKRHLTDLATLDPPTLHAILDGYAAPEINISTLDTPELYKILKHHKDNNLLCCLAFIFNTQICRKTAYKLLEYMESEEQRLYPLWTQLNMLQNQCYQSMTNAMSKPMNVNSSSSDGSSKKDMAEERSESIADSALNSYKSSASRIIDHELAKWTEELKHTTDPKVIETLQYRIEYYTRELQSIQYIQSLTMTNEYAPHPDFTFARDIISETAMREVKHILNPPKIKTRRGKVKEEKKGELEMTISIDYKDPFMRCVERGFMFYTQDLKDLNGRFQGITQTVLEKCGVQVIFSDGSYSYGINLPIRNVLFFNPEWSGELGHIDEIDMVQSAGRAGRRGLDTEGSVTCAGVIHDPILKREYRNIIGVDHITKMTAIPLLFNSKFNIRKLFKVGLKDFIERGDRSLESMEQINKDRILNDFRNNAMEIFTYGPMHIYRLAEVTDRALDLQKLFVTITQQSYDNVTYKAHEFIEIIASMHYVTVVDNVDFSSQRINDLITGATYEYGCVRSLSEAYKANNIMSNIPTTLKRFREIKEIVRIIASNNQNVIASWVAELKVLYKGINKLLFRFTV